MGNTLLCIENKKTLLDKLRFLILGDRHHKWMYDEKSLCRLLESAGSANPRFWNQEKQLYQMQELWTLKKELTRAYM